MAIEVFERTQEQNAFSIDEFLEQERHKDLLRFSTAGSVDDGKSTLIGRLLYDTRSVYDDQVRSIEGKGSAGAGQLDFALLTDGLRAEREQGITIDVAYRYFSTTKRKFIIADTPGHEQYTRNMATGASTADAAIVLVDARKGVLIQSRRHAYIAWLLGVRHIIVAVNKMDLVEYSESVFDTIRTEFESFIAEIPDAAGRAPELHFLPVSALMGDNVVHASENTPWYTGPALLSLLETLPTATATERAAFRFPVQRVIRPHQHFRGFAGQIASGTIRPGDSITVLPSGRSSRVESIVTWDGELASAAAPMSVTLTLEDELDISRGDLLVKTGEPAPVASRFTASMVWMNEAPLEPGRRYLLKHTSQTVPLRSVRVVSRVDLESLRQDPADRLALNAIGTVAIETRRLLALDLYGSNRITGSFVLIDEVTNATAGAGMVSAIDVQRDLPETVTAVTSEERAARWGHRGAVIELGGPEDLLLAIERRLFEAGAVTVRGDRLAEAERLTLRSAGVLVLVHGAPTSELSQLRIAGAESLTLEETETTTAAESVLRHLKQAGILDLEHYR